MQFKQVLRQPLGIPHRVPVAPDSPSTITSGFPPVAVATTGSPFAIASNSELEIPSLMEGRTYTSSALSISAIRLLDPETIPASATPDEHRRTLLIWRARSLLQTAPAGKPETVRAIRSNASSSVM